MLEAAVPEIGSDVKTVDKTTSKILDIHKAMAAKENAKLQLQELKQRFQRTMLELSNRKSQLAADIEGKEADLDAKLKMSSKTGIQLALWGVGFIALPFLVAMTASFLGKSASDGVFFSFYSVLQGL